MAGTCYCTSTPWLGPHVTTAVAMETGLQPRWPPGLVVTPGAPLRVEWWRANISVFIWSGIWAVNTTQGHLIYNDNLCCNFILCLPWRNNWTGWCTYYTYIYYSNTVGRNLIINKYGEDQYAWQSSDIRNSPATVAQTSRISPRAANTGLVWILRQPNASPPRPIRAKWRAQKGRAPRTVRWFACPPSSPPSQNGLNPTMDPSEARTSCAPIGHPLGTYCPEMDTAM